MCIIISASFIEQAYNNIHIMLKLIVCLTGMPGAGKSTIAGGLEKGGTPVFNMGDAVRAEAARQKIEPTGENLGKLMLELRQKNGPGAVANLVKPLMLKSNSDVVVVDGIRSNAEIEEFKKIAPLKILSVHASTDTRYGFLSKRGRPDDPDDRKSFNVRDTRELDVGISNSIALADESISNNNMTIQELVDTASRIIRGWIK